MRAVIDTNIGQIPPTTEIVSGAWEPLVPTFNLTGDPPFSFRLLPSRQCMIAVKKGAEIDDSRK